jgi:predicted choloylglycine hydrolase
MTMRTIPFTFRALEELELGPKWASLFSEHWPQYKRWFLSEGEEARASYATSARMLRAHMPELFPVYERLVELAGGGDLAARMLSIYRPPPYLAACSQAVWTRGGPMLVRNYDYAPSRLEGVVLSSRLTEHRVIGMTDCLWGLLDGMNDAGLAVSLTFGGRRTVGDGFGIPIVVRYVLETCATVVQAQQVLVRLPYTLAHNLTMVDGEGDVVTAYLSPDREPVFAAFPAATNHQSLVEWPEQAKVTRTVEREWHMIQLLQDPELGPEGFVDAFLREPLYSTAYARGFGTLFTAAYRPAERKAWFRWPSFAWEQSFDAFVEGTHTEVLSEGSVA